MGLVLVLVSSDCFGLVFGVCVCVCVCVCVGVFGSGGLSAFTPLDGTRFHWHSRSGGTDSFGKLTIRLRKT